jgi:hypothetical protein
MLWPNINTHAARYNNCSLRLRRRRPFHLAGERPSVIISEWASVKSAFFTLGDAADMRDIGSVFVYVLRVIKIIYCASATTHVMRARCCRVRTRASLCLKRGITYDPILFAAAWVVRSLANRPAKPPPKHISRFSK